jgi:DNA-binding CsgD family transcriptional regulator/PAS domain-containing protein
MEDALNRGPLAAVIGAPENMDAVLTHHLQRFIGNGAIGIFLKNQENRYLWVNETFAGSTGLEAKDLIGKRVEDLVDRPDIMSMLQQQDQSVYLTGKPLFNLIVPKLNGMDGYHRVDKIPLTDGSGSIIGILGLVVESSDPPDSSDVKHLKEKFAFTSNKLKETETALRVLIEGRMQDITKMRSEVGTRIRSSILPYLENLRKSQLKQDQLEFVELMEKNLKNFYDPTYAKLSSPSYRLSPTEIKVAQLIRDGKTNKEIAKLLHLSKSTILTHRHHIRAKLEIKNKKVNLRSLLNSYA